MNNTEHKKSGRRRRWIYSAAVILLVAAAVFFLLLSPAGYRHPPVPTVPGVVDPYLTNILLPRIYNGAQRGDPFDLLVEQEDITRAVASTGWPRAAGTVELSAPLVKFENGGITIVSMASTGAADVAVTIVVEPMVDRQGLVCLNVATVKVGSVNVTPLAMAAARSMYREKLPELKVREGDLRLPIIDSLINGTSFDCIFPVGDIPLRVTGLTAEKGVLKMSLAPGRRPAEQ